MSWDSAPICHPTLLPASDSVLWLENRLYSRHSKISLSSGDISTELQSHRGNCSLNVSAWKSARSLSLGLSKTGSWTSLSQPCASSDYFQVNHHLLSFRSQNLDVGLNSSFFHISQPTHQRVLTIPRLKHISNMAFSQSQPATPSPSLKHFSSEIRRGHLIDLPASPSVLLRSTIAMGARVTLLKCQIISPSELTQSSYLPFQTPAQTSWRCYRGLRGQSRPPSCLPPSPFPPHLPDASAFLLLSRFPPEGSG